VADTGRNPIPTAWRGREKDAMTVRQLVRSALRTRVLHVLAGRRLPDGSLEVHWRNRRAYLLLGDDRALAELARDLGPCPSLTILI
jgi:hypothetical protein